MTHDLLAKLDLLGKDLDAVLARDRADVPLRRRWPPASASSADVTRAGAHHRRRRLHRQHPRRSPDRRRASRSSSTTTSRTGRARVRRRSALRRGGASSCEGDVLDGAALRAAIEGCDTVFHLAGERRRAPRPRAPAARPRAEHDRHFDRARGDARARASRGSCSPRPARSTASPRSSRRPRTCPFPVQTSLYAASKLAGEGLIQAYCARATASPASIFRFVSILGERYTHGHVFDFYRAPARATRRACAVLGDGRQRSRTSTSATASRR